MDDPTRRQDGAWPGDRPVRWRWLARNLTWYLVTLGALLVQVALVVPVYVVGSAAGGAVGPLLALFWGAATGFAGWSWLMGRWRVVAAPIATAVAILVVDAFA